MLGMYFMVYCQEVETVGSHKDRLLEFYFIFISVESVHINKNKETDICLYTYIVFK